MAGEGTSGAPNRTHPRFIPSNSLRSAGRVRDESWVRLKGAPVVILCDLISPRCNLPSGKTGCSGDQITGGRITTICNLPFHPRHVATLPDPTIDELQPRVEGNRLQRGA